MGSQCLRRHCSRRFADREGDRRISGKGAILGLPFFLALKAEALHFADRTTEALEAIREAETLVERCEERWWRAELHRLRGVFLTALGADQAEIEASFRKAIGTAGEQKSISLSKTRGSNLRRIPQAKSEREFFFFFFFFFGGKHPEGTLAPPETLTIARHNPHSGRLLRIGIFVSSWTSGVPIIYFFTDASIEPKHAS